ncbi:MAG TPA: hypothetical protein VGI40_13730 [Pirellulaceae bacterium]|jgi:hypothetical protein
MRPIQDIFVGLVAIAIGCLLIGGAIFRSSLLMQLTKSRLLVESVGATAARWIIAGLGLFIVALGSLIAVGWRIQW